METAQPKVSMLIVAFLAVGLMADLMPHPNLGPGLVSSLVSHVLSKDVAVEAVKTASTNPAAIAPRQP